ncbi:tyrosine-type recombinase/integrase [Streptomyces sp. B-S-A8]|uniref:Tyrosine-type recombinase/integrase n=1 Tax=Streptomyces solicavernae TaxID=3043614 RepID=A0ABT6RPN1_9ACTN|nr:tyrosine-type recombinase/integrase [Streptomyces sp. B-S-A8]MDI3386362.1 tyrosine-type recombinase/integrase [Streptomyces sp. B-S-A8]
MCANLAISPLLDSWMIHLAAERKSAQTMKTYGDGVRAFVRWCEATGAPPELDRRTVNAFTAALLDGGAEPATARSRQLAVRRFSAWLYADGEIPADELVALRPPKLDVKVVESLDDDQLKALLKECRGSGFRDLRDEAIVRLMVETGARAGEVVNMTTDDIDLKQGAGVAVIRKGKGGRGRTVFFSAQCAQAVDRYLRKGRKGHRLADSPALWLGDRGKGLSYDGLYSALATRAAIAGIDGFHPHILRHTAATRWLAAGGSEGGLMAVAGWTRRDMLDRYTRASSERRAAEEARRLDLGNF